MKRVWIACFLFTVFVQGGLMVGAYDRISPIKFFSVMREAILFVFATCSSVAIIPLNLKCTKNLGADIQFRVCFLDSFGYAWYV